MLYINMFSMVPVLGDSNGHLPKILPIIFNVFIQTLLHPGSWACLNMVLIPKQTLGNEPEALNLLVCPSLSGEIYFV